MAAGCCPCSHRRDEARRRRRADLLSPAADDEGLVVEPQAAMFLQNLLRGIEVCAGGHHRIQPLVLDLIHIDGGFQAANKVEVPIRSPISEGSVCIS